MTVQVSIDIVNAARAGDAGALDQLLTCSRQDLRRYAEYHCEVNDVEDAVQETLFAASRRLRDLRQMEAWTSWLFRIVKRECNRMRRGWRLLTNQEIGATQETTQMHIVRLSALAAIFLLAISHTRASIAADYSREVPLWPEDSHVLQDGIRELAKEKWALTHPTFLLYSPQVRSTRSAILVFPGGGYKALAIGPNSTIGPNGADVCRWLTDSGVTCILVKYRVPNTGCNWNKEARRHDTPKVPMALQDAQRAISLVRFNAADYGIDPDRIGVMGFSAGGNLAVLSSTAFHSRSYDPVDEVDQVSSRPDFAIPVYPGHMTMEHKNKTPKAIAAQELNTDLVVSKDVPPTLLIHAKDDPIDPVHYSVVYERELSKAGVDVKLIVYETGGHAFGVRKQGKDTDRWTEDAIRWLREIKAL